MGEGILDITNTSLIFWEIVTIAILLLLLYWYVYPPIGTRSGSASSPSSRL
jgi:F0F1-type ATP synthase membrane subunit b/b'